VDPVSRLSLSDRLIRSAERKRPSDVLAIGLQERIVDLLELGDLRSLDATLGRYGTVVEDLRQPFFLWMHAAFRAMRTLLAGGLVQAEAQVHAALALGQRFGLQNAGGVFAVQLFELRRQQGRLGELEPILRKLVDEGSPIPAYHAGLATVYAQMGRDEEARRAVEELARHDFRDLAHDHHWAGTLAALVPAVAFLQDERIAQRIHKLLAPLAGRMIVGGYGTVCLGTFDDALAALVAVITTTPRNRSSGEAQRHNDPAQTRK
jgi:hypothetical protein